MRECPFGALIDVCNEWERCFRCATIEHDNAHPDYVEGCRSCKFATLHVSPAVRGVSRNQIAPQGTQNNSWEKGVALDHRGLPYRDFKTGNPIPTKRFSERRTKFEEGLRAVHNGAI